MNQDKLIQKRRAEFWVSPLSDDKQAIFPQKSLIGHEYGNLYVVSYAGYRIGQNYRNKSWYWWCRCSCGNPELVKKEGRYLVEGKIKSCGCLNGKHKTAKKVATGPRRLGQQNHVRDGDVPWDTQIRMQSAKFERALRAYCRRRAGEDETLEAA